MAATKTKPRSKAKRGPLRTNAPQRGQWRGQKQSSQGDEIGFKIVTVKLRESEKEEFKRVSKQLGVTPNRAMRIMARRTAGFLELPNSAIEDLTEITKQITGVSRNINQIAKAANITKSPDYRAFMEDRRELGVYLGALEGTLRELTAVSKRRSDGLADLHELIAEEERRSL